MNATLCVMAVSVISAITATAAVLPAQQQDLQFQPLHAGRRPRLQHRLHKEHKIQRDYPAHVGEITPAIHAGIGRGMLRDEPAGETECGKQCAQQAGRPPTAEVPEPGAPAHAFLHDPEMRRQKRAHGRGHAQPVEPVLADQGQLKAEQPQRHVQRAREKTSG
jgi:hypothetical protein